MYLGYIISYNIKKLCFGVCHQIDSGSMQMLKTALHLCIRIYKPIEYVDGYIISV